MIYKYVKTKKKPILTLHEHQQILGVLILKLNMLRTLKPLPNCTNIHTNLYFVERIL